jgi:hypothetical protein
VINNVRNPLETGGNDGEAVEQSGEQKIVAIRTGQKITVEDAVWSCDNSLLRLFIEGDGIDCTVPSEQVELVVKSRAGSEVIRDE